MHELSFTHPYLLGDGGNDVSMIQAANVGVGIVGKVSSKCSLLPCKCLPCSSVYQRSAKS